MASEADEATHHIHVGPFSYFNFFRVFVLQIEMDNEIGAEEITDTDSYYYIRSCSEEIIFFILDSPSEI